MAWTPRGVFVWGGCLGSQCDDTFTGVDEFVDGAFYDWRHRSWTVVADSPLSPRDGAVASWNGELVIVWGGDGGANANPDGAAYNPAKDAWEHLPLSPLEMPRKGHSMTVIDNGQVVIWGGHGMVVPIDIANGEYDLNPYDTGAVLSPDGIWRAMAPSPLNGRDRHSALWTGSELLIVGGCCGINGDGSWTPAPLTSSD
jgi:hypothetical protein